jgi:uncharacterized membrane protein YphA (DoxX/SURF4 family)
VKIIVWISRIVAAFIMLQTLYFKFSGAEESVFIFTQVGMEPWGRYAVGLGELIASLLIIIPRASWIGGLIAVGLMTGAITMHLFILGIVVFDDGGQLFIYAITVFICGAYNLWVDRDKALALIKK